eukprot:CAMPEP_0201931702 /NCGR_PEP_ID=MMETSP0903-20130614/27896_1 /ASSEMBLY_ACC=CAM_ASM_000552 /TAXON_ID=420261 /ORGANISM="Thalassiosira antarctica, Strain CCMP982" /LENGTH=605 /DNA_ID=CAMNT_0048471105 /DNA_START=160 /DNA_END=1977 /DNA_ORIENTATION=-
MSFAPIVSRTANKRSRTAEIYQQHHALDEATADVDDQFLTPIPADQYHEANLPKVFAYPHCYEPHPIASMAADQLREQFLSSSSDFQAIINDDTVGKMMGVLVVRYGHHNEKNNNQQQQLGYLKAYSGTLPTGTALSSEDEFCPSLYNRFGQDGFYKRGEEDLNELTRLIEQIEQNPERKTRRDHLTSVEESCNERWSAAKTNGKMMQKERRSIRKQQKTILDENEYDALDERLKQEGAAIQREMKQLKSQINQETQDAQNAVQEMEHSLKDLKDTRRGKSRELQDQLFNQYNFLNANGEKQSLLPMFANTPLGRPPSGAGDCAAPKLFQHAFRKGYEPIALAEFWWGTSPTNEVRRHNLYYPACRGKCLPILEHMLQGVDVESNPMDIAPAEESSDKFDLEILYEDEYFVVVNKPEGMLSAPGRTLEFSVYSMMKEKYPEATGPLLVHRLDMATSGVLLVAKDKDTHKALAAQFIDRSIQKRYVALLNGELKQNNKKGNINLPLAPDYINRPMQMVSEEGKPAQTIYEVIDVVDGLTRVNFYPVTGRTHQLRVHAAHSQGLDCPIVGDDIYGSRDDRLCLHAGYLELTHPVTQKRMTFTAATPF